MVATRTCLSIDEVTAYTGGGGSIRDLPELDVHLDGCEPCRRQVAAAVRAGRAATADPDRDADDGAAGIVVGSHLDRYVVREVRGSGATSHVYVAHDPDLHRTIALKLVRHRDELADERALREGRALARLAHPNVVAVYDVGAWAGGVFLAMELVDGTTVREWAQTRPWRDVVRVIAAAARGLAAAHAVGLVHRDVKPDNLVVGSDARVRVIDFGLAIDPATTDYTVAGTPAYMAPEQRAGARVDARCDQYALAISLFEMLEGRRPEGELRFARRVPRWLRAAIQRATRTDPAARFDDMAVLARALDTGLALRGRVALGTGALAAIALTIVGVRALSGDGPSCTTGADQLAGVWDGDRARALKTAFDATGKPFATAAARAVTQTLDGYAHAWAMMRDDACAATERGEQSPDLLDRRMACLDGRRAELRALVDVLVAANATVVQRSVSAVQGLAPLDACADRDALLAAVPPPATADARRRADAIRARLANVVAARRAGVLATQTSLAPLVLADARALGYLPLVAEATREAALARVDAADPKGAEALLLDTVHVAEESRTDRVRAEALIRLVSVVGHDLKRYAEAEEWARQAAATIKRIGGPRLLEARLERFLALLAHGRLQFDEAVRRYRRARELLAGLDPVPLEITYVDTNLGLALAHAGDYDGGEQALDRVVATVEAAYGRQHPDVAMAFMNKGMMDLNRGRFDVALTRFEEAARINEAALGSEHVTTAGSYANIGATLDKLGRPDEARAMTQRAFEIRTRLLGPDAEPTLMTQFLLGISHYQQADYAPALEHFRRVAAGKRKLYGPDHGDVAQAHVFEGAALHFLGRSAEALPILESALAIQDKVLGKTNPMTGFSADTLGSVYVAVDRPACGLPFLERAYALRPQDPAYVASLEKRLAEARVAARGKRCTP